MQGSDMIFCLQSKAYAFWKPDSSGGITINNQPYFLNFSPAGWDEIAIQNIRNKKYWGIDRTVTIPLSYVQDGAEILKYIFYTLGTEETVYLTIASQQLEYTPGVSYGYWYKQIFRGEVDLSTFMHNGTKITCTTLEDGLPKFLKANENTTYEFPMDVPEAINVKMDGINLHENLRYGLSDGLNYANHIYIADLPLIGEEGNHVNVVVQSQTMENVTAVPDFQFTSLNSAIENLNSYDILVSLKGTIAYKLISAGGGGMAPQLVLYFKNDLTVTPISIGSLAPVPAIGGSTAAILINMTFTLRAGDTVFLVYRGSGGASYTIAFLPDSILNFSFITSNASTFIKAFRPQYLFTQLVNRFTEGNYSAAIANYFQNYKSIVFTCGNAIRGLSDAVMKISWSDFFQFWDSFDSVGISSNSSTINFDAKVNLIDKSKVITLGGPETGSFKVSVAKEFLWNELAIGYPEIKNDVGGLNGNGEFNCGYLFSIGTTKSPAKIDKISKIKASCYEIELIRVTTFQKDSTDNKNDNDLFVLAIENTLNPEAGGIAEYYNLDRSLNPTATGLIEKDTVFNIPLSPKRMLNNNGRYLRSSLWICDNKILSYRTVDKNNKLVAGGIVEKADVPVSSLGDRFFNPILMDGDFQAPDNLEGLLDMDPLTVFSFPVDGTYYSGILQKVSIAPSSRKVQSYQFYSDSLNDLTKLISYFG